MTRPAAAAPAGAAPGFERCSRTPFWEKTARLKTDSAETGPPEGVPVMLGAGMRGDRVPVIVSDSGGPARFNEKHC